MSIDREPLPTGAEPSADNVSDEAVRAKVASVLTATTSLYLATSGTTVWNAGAFFAVLDQDPFRLALVLELGGTTLANLRTNP